MTLRTNLATLLGVLTAAGLCAYFYENIDRFIYSLTTAITYFTCCCIFSEHRK